MSAKLTRNGMTTIYRKTELLKDGNNIVHNYVKSTNFFSKPHISYFNKVDAAGHVDGTSTLLKNEMWGLEKMRRNALQWVKSALHNIMHI